MDVYISRVNGWPCGKQLSSILLKVLRTVSTFNTGTNYSYELLTSLKGSKKSKLKLWHDKPELHAYFQGKSEHWGGNSSCGCYWKVHVDLLLPGCHHHCTRREDQYHHPHGTMEDLLLCNFLFQKWISTQTMGRYVGATCRCNSCSDTCYGHYMATIFVGWWIALLPSSILKKEFHSQGHYSESFIQKTVQMALLSINLDQTSHYCISE